MISRAAWLSSQYAEDYEFKTDVLYGDVNSDSKVNIADRITLTRNLAGWTDYAEINTDNADVDDNGTVNLADRIVLTRHLAGWADYAELPYKK